MISHIICAHILPVVVSTKSWHSARCHRYFCICLFGGLRHFHSFFFGGRCSEHIAPNFVEIFIVIAIVVLIPIVLLAHVVRRTFASQSIAVSADFFGLQGMQACTCVKIVFFLPAERRIIRIIDRGGRHSSTLFSTMFVLRLLTIFSQSERCVGAAG